MGWSTDAVRRDLTILRDVIENDLRQELPAGADGREVEQVLKRLFEQAEQISLQGWHYARSDNRGRGPTPSGPTARRASPAPGGARRSPQ